MGLYGSTDLSASTDLINTYMVQCPRCGYCYNRKMRRCPRCGKRFARPFYYKCWFWLLVIFIIFLKYSPDTNTNTDSGINSAVPGIVSVKPIISEDEYKAQCTNIPYINIARNPNDYIGQKAVFRGKVVQVQENSSDIMLRIDVTQNSYGFWDDTIYVDYKRKTENETRILKNDIVTIYGEVLGIKNYTAVLGNQISIPHIKAEYVVIGE